MQDIGKTVYLMRGLPACGKSYTATRLAGSNGIVLATDQYFYTEVGDDAASYDYHEELLAEARRWNLARFRDAIAREISPIVVDRGNGLNSETREYAAYAVERGYEVELREPDSPWWQELKVLLKYRKHVSSELLDAWAKRLADATRQTHRVPTATIRRWMKQWRYDITIQDILDCEDVRSSRE